MSRQHTTPVLINAANDGSVALTARPFSVGLEEEVQRLVHEHPTCLPIPEIDSLFANPVAICRELRTPAGSIDNLLLTPSGLPVIVECKLWRNPQARREVVGQILDYAKELRHWSCADLTREVSRSLKWEASNGDPIVHLMQAAGHQVNEVEFNDNVTNNLRRGRCMLLIVGDGIREGVEAVVEYLQNASGLHFTLGIVEMPVYDTPGGEHIVMPRVLARTVNITRNVIAAPEGYVVEEPLVSEEAASGLVSNPAIQALGDRRQAFWKAFLDQLVLDDPEQSRPKPSRQGYLAFSMPAPGGSSWITVYRDQAKGVAGLFLSSTRKTVGDRASEVIADDWDTVREELGNSAILTVDPYDRRRISDEKAFGPMEDAAHNAKMHSWLSERLNVFVNVLRPRIKSYVAGQNNG